MPPLSVRAQDLTRLHLDTRQVMLAMALVAIGGMMRKIEIDEYVIETLMRDLVGHDRQASAFLIYLYLWWLTEREADGRVTISLNELAEGSGLSKRAVQDAVAKLHKRRLISIKRESMTAVPEYAVLRPWARR
jgi:CRP-like cAMP-binding protein